MSELSKTQLNLILNTLERENKELRQKLEEAEAELKAMKDANENIDFKEVCETLYIDSQSWFESHILAGELPNSVNESVQIIYEHWLATKNLDPVPAMPEYYQQEWRRNIMLMWSCVRKHDSSIPSDVLDFMREFLLSAAPKPEPVGITDSAIYAEPPQTAAILEAIKLLAEIFDLYEDGIDCYSDYPECEDYIGKAIRINDRLFDSCVNLLTSAAPKPEEE